MKTLRLLIATGISLVALSAVVRAESGFGRQWMDNYSQAPRPDLLVKAVYSLNSDGYFDRGTTNDTAIGFFSSVFKQNPAEVASWLRSTDTFLPDHPRRVLAAAAWLAGNPAGAERIRALSGGVDPEVRAEVYQLLASSPTPVADTPVVSEASMNLQWGAFLASGDERHIIRVFTALGSNQPGLATSARFTLAQNAAANPRVLEICREQLDRQPQPIRSELQAAMNDAVSHKPGA